MYEQVLEFHETMHLPIAVDDSTQRETIEGRLAIMHEEFWEVIHALDSGSRVEIAHELADFIYSLLGTAVTYGIDLDRVFAAVHAANMTKRDDDGQPYMQGTKVVKGANYIAPDIEAILHDV